MRTAPSEFNRKHRFKGEPTAVDQPSGKVTHEQDFSRCPTTNGRSFPVARRQQRRDTGVRLEVARKRIVIVGAGFAGIAATRALKRSDADIVVVDRRNHHIFQPLLYQVATAVLAPSEIAAPIRQLAKNQKNVEGVESACRVAVRR